MSRWISAALVTIVTGWLNSRSTSRIERVMPSRRSAGWYGSVLLPSAIGLAGVALAAQLLAQQGGGLRLVEDAGLEIEAGRQAEIGVARPRDSNRCSRARSRDRG